MSTTFVHSVCGAIVYADLGEHFRILTNFAAGKNVMLATRGEVIEVEDVTEAKYYCNECKRTVPVKEIEARCQECGGKFKITELFKGATAGIILCNTCKDSNSFSDKSFKSLEKMATKISTRNL